MLINFIFAFAASGLPAAAFAHGGHHYHDHGRDHVSLTEVPLDGMNVDQYRRLLDEAHHSIEEEPEGNFFQRWRGNFQFKKSMLNAYRWYSSHRGVPHVDNAAANIAAMLLTSHSIETVGGLAMAGSGVGHGLDGIVDLALTTVGVTITIPGLDPLCLILVGAYNKWPRAMDKFLTVPRLFVVGGSKFALRAAGIPQEGIQSWMKEKLKRRFLRAAGAGGSQIFGRIDDEDNARFTISGSQPAQSIILQMRMQPQGHQALESITFSPKASAIVRPYLQQLVSPFGLNIREAVLQIDSFLLSGNLTAMARLPYVERVDDNERTVYFKPGAFPFHSFSSADFCERLLR